ncbi:MAG: hypothetical protein A4E35_01028 [Methanoregula sp. PtaU1.Bin051]|nr:MAG: hypothetical protein A4E35_01028 [Methanoregula sp. PtaU1.Bin051]
MEMGIESTNHKDVAETDQIVSGAAGTGQENRKNTKISDGSTRNVSSQRSVRNREVIGLGVLYNGPMNAGTIPDTTHCAGKKEADDPPEGYGDLIFSLYERQERIADRLNKKIARLDRRLTKFEERRKEEWENEDRGRFE